MAEKVVLEDGSVCTMKKARRSRHIRITVHRDGGVAMTLPFFVSYRRGEEFLRSKTGWIREKVKAMASRPDNLLLRGSREEYLASLDRARHLVEERLSHFRQFYVVTWKQVSIRNQKARWGSCSRTGGLSFNYRLLLLPAHLRDYVIVHEICHLLAFDHSPRFWALVAETFPDYRALRRELRLL